MQEFENFTALCLAYPTLYHIEIIKEYLPIHHLGLKIWATGIDAPISAIFPEPKDWTNELDACPPLRHLGIDLPLRGMFEVLHKAGKLAQLEEFRLYGGYWYRGQHWDFSPEDSTFVFENLPALRVLYVSRAHKIAFRHTFSCLEELYLANCEEVFLPDLLAKLTPAVLQTLSVEMAEKLFFVGEADKKNKEKLKMPFEDLNKFSALKSIAFTGNKWAELPFSLSHFHHLETLDISNNKNLACPREIITLPHLKRVNLLGTPVWSKKIIRGESDIIKLSEHFRKINLPIEDRYRLFDILLEQYSSDSLEELLRLYILANYKFLTKKILSLCEKFVSQPDTKGLKYIAFLGNFPSLPPDQIQDVFAENGVILENKITDNTQLACVGEGATSAQIQSVLRQCIAERRVLLCFPAQTKQLITALENPYLQNDAPEGALENLENLLLSNDKNNVLLAFQLMKNGGMPPLFFEYLCLMVIEKPWGLARQLLPLLDKYATAAQFEVIKKLQKFSQYSKEARRVFLSSTEFDIIKIIQALEKFYIQDVRDSRLFVEFIKASLWEITGENFDKFLSYYMEDGHLSIFLNKHFIRKFPASLAGRQEITSLELDAHLIMYETSRKLVRSLPNLKAITVHIAKGNQDNLQDYYERAFPMYAVAVAQSA